MKAAKATLAASLDRPDERIRFYLFYGQDDAGSHALAHRLLKSLGAERFVVTAGAVKGDPALLADEASAMGLFGDKRLLWIEPADDSITDGVAALLGARAVESVAIAIAGALKKSSTLLKLSESHGAALAHASYLPEGRDAERMVSELGRAEGLRVSPEIASQVATAAGANQSIVASEMAKYALFLGASPDSVVELDRETIDLLGADSDEGDWQRIGDLALDGRLADLGDAIQRLGPGAPEIVPILRSLQRRVLQLVPLRARIERGESVEAVLSSMGKALFWKDKPILSRLLTKWTAAKLAQLAERIGVLERRLMLSSVPGDAALGEELFAVARAARRSG